MMSDHRLSIRKKKLFAKLRGSVMPMNNEINGARQYFDLQCR
jgi:hypothetical protein